MTSAWAARLPAWSLMGAVISAAGLPIYIYAPKFYADNFGVSLASLAWVLFALRLFDMVQDPVFGWISERLRRRALAVTLGGFVLGASMLGLFAVAPPINATVWFAITITGLFSAFSFLTINFYGQGVAKAEALQGGHNRLAGWRESGALLGVCIAAVMPTALMGVTDAPFTWFAVGFAVVTLAAVVAMSGEWAGRISNADPVPMRVIFGDKTARRLLILAFVNAAPLAVSSTMFLFYVEGRLQAPGWEGALLVLFFLAAALSSPIWSRLADRFDNKSVLLVAMVAAVASFGATFTLGPGDHIQFAVICVLSGATIGADLTLLPAMFAKRMARVAPNGGQGFGLWSLMNKFTLAFAAVLLLPLLEGAGYDAGTGTYPEQAQWMLMVLYAVVPSVLKMVAIALLAATRLEDAR